MRGAVCLFILFLISPSVSVGEYRIKPGDTLSIFVLNHEEYNQVVRVRSDGKISYFFGDVQAAGLTVEELRKRIEGMLRFLKNPVVLVSVQPSGNRVFVFGAVKNPGGYDFQTESLPLLKALAMAGGYDEERADLSSAMVIRSDGALERIDLEGLLEGRGKAVSLRAGDSLYVPELETIRVTGYVSKPGVYRVREAVPLKEALAMAGGPVQGDANMRKVVLFRRGGETVEVDVEEEFWRGGSVKVNPGDTVYVPSAYRYDEVSVLGAVRSPGSFKVKGEITIFQALALAGGALDQADLKSAKIIHPDGSATPVDIKRLYSNPREGIPLRPGDTLLIPERFRVNWTALLTLLSVISTTLTLVRGLR